MKKKNKIEINLDKPDLNLFPKDGKSFVIGKCPSCNNLIKNTSFDDEEKLREFSFSGLCAKCQKKKQ